MGFSSGAAMLVIITPWRWPVQWCIFMALLVFAGSRSTEIIESTFVKALFESRTAGVGACQHLLFGNGLAGDAADCY